MKINCKFCNKPAPSNMRGYCQSCYKYFILENKEIYPLPEYGEITFAPNGDAICPFCGKAFRKLGLHFYYQHGMITKKAFEKAGWNVNTRASNEKYQKLMREKLQEHCVDINLIEKGKPTRFKKNSKGRPRELIRPMEMNRLRRNKKDEGNL